MDAPGQSLEIDFLDGFCPVQAEGRLDGEPFLFRARGDRWSLSVGGRVLSDPAWRHEESYGTWPDAGWIEEPEARRLIERGAALYRSRDPRPGVGDRA